MFDTYFANDGAADAAEFNRNRQLVVDMVAHVGTMSAPQASSLIAQLDRIVAMPALPSVVLRSYLDHSLLNLLHIVETIIPGRGVAPSVIMAALRVSLLASSRLCFVVAARSLEESCNRMRTVYALEVRSARKYVRIFNEKSELPDMHPEMNSAVAQFASTNGTRADVTESRLLGILKSETLTDLAAATALPIEILDVLTDQLFQTTSGAAHGYMWIDLDGVVAHFIAQFGWTTTLANVVFNKYLTAAS